MPVFIYDEDAMQRIAAVEQEVMGADPEWMTRVLAMDDHPSHFPAFLAAWNELQADRQAHGRPFVPARTFRPVFEDLSVWTLKSRGRTRNGGSSQIYGYGGWHRYMVDNETGEIIFDLGFIEESAESVRPIVEGHGFRTYPSSSSM